MCVGERDDSIYLDQVVYAQSGQEAERKVIPMKCTFMHKNIAVAEMELDDVTGFIKKINDVYEPKHLPIGVPVKKGIADRASLNDWWIDRSIPASRSGIREALEALDITSTKMLLVRCYGLSLSDQYWICPEGTDLTWDKINFFENDFSQDIGDVLFGAKKKENAFDFSSPDNTSDGNLKKRWKMIDGKRCLVKGGSNPFRQQPLNEVIAAGIMERLGVLHVPYTVVWNQGAPYSVCEDFITGETELIPAWRIMQTQKQENGTSRYQHFVNCCEKLGIRDVIPYLDQMITVDYIIANEDRHLNNFGAVRNAETLEWIGMAPIYDSGSSLGYDKLANQIRSERDITCKPFKQHQEEQVKLVSSFAWIDFGRLSDVRALVLDTLMAGKASDYMDAARAKAIADTVEKRIRRVSELAMSNTSGKKLSRFDDVAVDVAESYSS